MHFRISCATILVNFCPLKWFCNAQTYKTQSTVRQSGFYERISYNKFLSKFYLNLEYARFAEGGQLFWGLSTLSVAERLLGGGFGGMLSPQKYLNGAIWCALEHIFINFLLSKSPKIFFFYTKIMINCSNVLAKGSRSMIHCPLIIFIKGCNL